ncbi:hypothetical protein BXZ70DRAFT_596887 [Cristinia sonorae]|uniref:RGS domain-containing protein n=1 Tax=Cristinia sonorae TaxID=1940300 RepID=A0A8K0UUA9_9AGAR|nr:hypothetical protein BXZ70DRAFT_596887 [Cristinia sonorae]
MPLWRNTDDDHNVAGPSRLARTASSIFARRPSDPAMVATSSTNAAAPAPRAPLPVPTTPAPGLQYATPPPPQTQPKTVKLTPSAILSLPHRLAHPPPAKGQIPSWGVIPAFDIRLEDVLDRKHLPPLGLKDFEEWLLFVDDAVENLYFILWLREYTARYTAWAQHSKKTHELLRASTSSQSLSLSTASRPIRTNLTDATRSPINSLPNTTFCHSPSTPVTAAFPDSTRYPLTHPQPPSPCPSRTPSPSPPRRQRRHHRYFDPPTPPSSLALFYLRAKETFLTPRGPYELHVHSDVLSVFHLSSSTKNSSKHVPLAPPPDPAIFNELASIVEEKLKESLAKFVVATYNNVGMPRAHCGSAGGISIGLVWSVPILATNFSLGGARWWRLLALPGMWLGLTVFISAMYGVCMMIYIFGDLRQLRSFELVRPQISPPKPLSHSGREKKLAEGVVSAPMKPLTRPPKARVTFTTPAPPIVPPTTPVLRIDPATPRGSDEDPNVTVRERTTVTLPIPAVPRTPVRSSTFHRDDAASYSSYSYSSSESDSDSESSSSSSDSSNEQEEDSMKLRQSAQNQRRRPRIIISDAFYDEHPSPEGPATATGEMWYVAANQTRGGVAEIAVSASRRGSLGVGAGAPAPGMPPLWPDYEANAEEETNATAAFIKPFVYDFDNYRFGTAPYLYTPSRSYSDDIEAQAQQRVAELQPVDSFDFDALPPSRRNRPATWAGTRPTNTPGPNQHHDVVGIIHSDNGLSDCPPPPSSSSRKPCWSGQLRMKLGVEVVPPRRTDSEGRICEKPRSVTPGQGTTYVPGDAGSDAGSVRGFRRWTWVWRWMGQAQARCSPGNAVEMHRKAEKSEKAAAAAAAAAASNLSPPPPVTHTPSSSPSPRLFVPPHHPSQTPSVADPRDVQIETVCPVAKATAWRKRFRKVSAVPAFASPLTPVLNPIVGRAQWEIVVRSAMMAAVISAVVVGALVSVPVKQVVMGVM